MVDTLPPNPRAVSHDGHHAPQIRPADDPELSQSAWTHANGQNGTSNSVLDKATSIADGAGETLHSALKYLRDVFSNEDTAYSPAKRNELGVRGLVPPAHESIEIQSMRALKQLRLKTSSLEKYIYLSALRQSNVKLFYRLLVDNLMEIVPLVYTPTVGDACVNFSNIYRRPEGLSISLEDRGNIAEVVANWPIENVEQPRIAVITDGSRILGLGDLGWNGLGISIGKLSLYIAAAGIHPASTIPIVVDLGTNNESNLEDPLYLGLRQKRPDDNVYIPFMDEVMEALHKFPNLIVQFEDFSTERAFLFLDRYKDKYPMFNDDIQGTGSVILGGFTNAARIASEAAGTDLRDQRILFYGAGSAGVGVAKQLLDFFTKLGMSEEEAKKRFWLVDTKGLITKDRGDKLPAHKQFFARDDNEGKQFKVLSDIIEYCKPTALLGLSTSAGAFGEEVIKTMAKINKRPIIFPLSNPSALSECTFEQAVEWTDGQAVFAAGSPFAPLEYKGKKYIPGQGNNMYVFPGIGLGGGLCKTSRVTDSMITTAALALADSLNEAERAEGRVYPELTRVREVSRDIACAVIRKANEEGVARDDGETAKMSDAQLKEWVEQQMWQAKYADTA